jgi:phosphoribosylformylglycinamidine synthase PurS subunit
MNYRVHIHIVPRKGLLDPQGKAVADALHALGFHTVHDVRIGRHIVVDVTAPDAAAAQEEAHGMCTRLLANPVTEDYELAKVEAT